MSIFKLVGDLSGKAAIPSLDLLDHFKRRYSSLFVSYYKLENNDLNILAKKTEADSINEVYAIIKFRSERFTLERVFEMNCIYHGMDAENELNRVKTIILKSIVSNKDLEKIKLNKSIKEVMLNLDTLALSLDFLVATFDKLSIFSNEVSEKTLEAILN